MILLLDKKKMQLQSKKFMKSYEIRFEIITSTRV